MACKLQLSFGNWNGTGICKEVGLVVWEEGIEIGVWKERSDGSHSGMTGFRCSAVCFGILLSTDWSEKWVGCKLEVGWNLYYPTLTITIIKMSQAVFFPLNSRVHKASHTLHLPSIPLSIYKPMVLPISVFFKTLSSIFKTIASGLQHHRIGPQDLPYATNTCNWYCSCAETPLILTTYVLKSLLSQSHHILLRPWSFLAHVLKVPQSSLCMSSNGQRRAPLSFLLFDENW